MKRLVIKNIGAIRHVEFDVNRINVFMGPQSSGKSTISKILCHCQWVEKTCFMNSKEVDWYGQDGVFYSSLVEYHKLEGYFNKTAYIKYTGDYLTITYRHSTGNTVIKQNDRAAYCYPKISYIPSERNFVSGVSNFSKYNEGNNVILYFGYDWSDAKKEISKLDISKLLNRSIVYENQNDKDYIYDNGSRLSLVNASSGIQSILPLYQTILYMLSNLYAKPRVLSPSKEYVKRELGEFLAVYESNVDRYKDVGKRFPHDTDRLMTIFNSLGNVKVRAISKLGDLTRDQLIDNIRNAADTIGELFRYHYTKLFIEEPEQNLFPDTQQEFVYWLLANMTDAGRNHSAVITTHSPYILFALNNCMMGGLVRENIPADVANSFPSHLSWVAPIHVSVFEIEDGRLRCIQDEDGIIEDNYLNKAYKKNSNEYLSLLNYYSDEN